MSNFIFDIAAGQQQGAAGKYNKQFKIEMHRLQNKNQLK
jgi:hypothetical protein